MQLGWGNTPTHTPACDTAQKNKYIAHHRSKHSGSVLFRKSSPDQSRPLSHKHTRSVIIDCMKLKTKDSHAWSRLRHGCLSGLHVCVRLITDLAPLHSIHLRHIVSAPGELWKSYWSVAVCVCVCVQCVCVWLWQMWRCIIKTIHWLLTTVTA